MAFPNFIIGGPPKCGTTSLYSWLNEHPDACASKVKETYFLYRADEAEKGIHHFSDQELVEYSSYFEQCDHKKIIFEATPSYIYSDSARQALVKINADMKILFVLREPSSRLYSEYTFHRFKTGKFKGDFASYVVKDRLNESHYGPFIEKWVTSFGNANVRVIHFKDLSDRPSEVMNRISLFLNIDPSLYEDFNFEQKNKTVIVRNKSIHKWLVKLVYVLPLQLIKRLSPMYYGMNSKRVPKISNEDKAEKDRLKLLLKKDWENVLTIHSDLFLL